MRQSHKKEKSFDDHFISMRYMIGYGCIQKVTH